MPEQSAKTVQGQAVELEFEGAEGVTLRAEAWGDSSAMPVILAHGGGQTRNAWGTTAQDLAAVGWYSIAYDLRGHGESGRSPTGSYRLPLFGEDMCRIAASLEHKPVVVGASLGGLSSMMAWSQHWGKESSPLFRAIVLVDITPRMSPDGVSKIRGFMRERAYEGFTSVQEASDAIAAYLPHRKRPDSLEGLAKNLREKDGRYYWHWDPEFMLGDDPPNSMQYLDRLKEACRTFDCPVMLIRGRMSDLITMEAVEEFLEDVPHAQFVDVKKAGHMIAGERNDLFNDAVVSFLKDL